MTRSKDHFLEIQQQEADCSKEYLFQNFDDRVDVNDPSLEEDEVYYCNVCGREINQEGICNSKACFKADNM